MLKGFVEDAGNGLLWFNTEEREKENRRPLLVDRKEVKVLVKG